jgi:RNA polymerase subunit RPABC4/transcription elongation factor Spt4
VTDDSTEVAPHSRRDSTGSDEPTGRFPGSAARLFFGHLQGILSLVMASSLFASAFGSVHGLLHSTAFDIALDAALAVVVAFWLGLAFWTFRDARRRMDDWLLVGLATLLGLAIPFVGPVIYMLFRPPEILDDVRVRDLGLRTLEERAGQRELQCPVCRAVVAEDYHVCPVCTTRLKQPCPECAAPLEPSWQVCPYCAASLVAPPVVSSGGALGLDNALTAAAAAAGRRSTPRRGRSARTPL